MAERVLRLGLVGPLPPPNGGMAMQTMQLSRLLGEADVAVEVLQTNAPYRPAVVEHIKGVRALFRLLPYLVNLWRLAGRVDVIHLMANSGWSWQLFAAPAIWIARWRGTPVIVNYRGGEARDYLSRSLRSVKPSIDCASCLVVPSRYLHGVFKEFGITATIVPNIIDIEAFSPPASASERDTFNIVITRNLEPIYGLDTALRAFAIALGQAPALRLRIAGSGPQLGELQRLAAALGISKQVEFLGRLDRDAVIALYGEADAMLNPTRVDNMPNSVLEALACCVPVVSTDVGGVPYIVEHTKTALLVKPDDADDMAQALLRLFRDSHLRERLRHAGRQEVQQYSWDNVRPSWLSLYFDVRRAA